MYNCVLDACVYAGDPARFRVLTTTMREKFGRLDIGFLQHHAERTYFGWRDIRCLHVVSGMEWGGIKPNDTSYNILENSAVSIGNFQGGLPCR